MQSAVNQALPTQMVLYAAFDLISVYIYERENIQLFKIQCEVFNHNSNQINN